MSTEPTELIAEARAIAQAKIDSALDAMPPKSRERTQIDVQVPIAALRVPLDALETTLAERDEARRDMDARWEHSDHLAAKYYQRMRAAERARAAAEDAVEAQVRDIRDITALSRRAVADAWDQGYLVADNGEAEDNPYRKETT